MPGKGRATAYGDFYKGRESTPDNRLDEEDQPSKGKKPTPRTLPRYSTQPPKDMQDRRKAALRKKLANVRGSKG